MIGTVGDGAGGIGAIFSVVCNGSPASGTNPMIAMKPISGCLLAMLILCHLATQRAGAQLQDEFDLEPEYQLPYVGSGAGFTPTVIFIDVDELNALAAEVELDGVNNPMLTYGASIVFTPIFIRNVRVGFNLMIGYHATDGTVRINAEEYLRKLRFGIRFMGGVQAEYAIRLSTGLVLMPGLVTGIGSYALEFTQSRSGTLAFEEAWNPDRFNGSAPPGTSRNYAMMLERNVLFLRPTVSLEYALTPFVMARLGTGYNLGLPGGWVDESGAKYDGVPDVSANGPTIQLGLFIGLFSQ